MGKVERSISMESSVELLSITYISLFEYVVASRKGRNLAR